MDELCARLVGEVRRLGPGRQSLQCRGGHPGVGPRDDCGECGYAGLGPARLFPARIFPEAEIALEQ